MDKSDHPNTVETERKFSDLLCKFYIRDASTLPAIFTGMRQWIRSRRTKIGAAEQEILNTLLDDFFVARLSIRMLIGHHTEANKSVRSTIKRGLAVADVARDAASTSRALCLKRFGICPEIEIKGNQTFKFSYVESHLHHMLFELLKNSVRAVVELHSGVKGEKRREALTLSSRHVGSHGLPPVIVVVSGGEEDVVIKVSDVSFLLSCD